MADFDFTISVLIIDELFDNYIIIVNTTCDYTSVYCEECEQWVGQYEGDQISTHSTDELYEKIIDDHKEQVLGTAVTFI